MENWDIFLWSKRLNQGEKVKNKEMRDVHDVNNFSKKRSGEKVIIEKLIPFIVDKFTRDMRTITLKLDGNSDHNIENYVYVKKEIMDTNLPIIINKTTSSN